MGLFPNYGVPDATSPFVVDKALVKTTYSASLFDRI
jgi:hypothetical protein